MEFKKFRKGIAAAVLISSAAGFLAAGYGIRTFTCQTQNQEQEEETDDEEYVYMTYEKYLDLKNHKPYFEAKKQLAEIQGQLIVLREKNEKLAEKLRRESIRCDNQEYLKKLTRRTSSNIGSKYLERMRRQEIEIENLRENRVPVDYSKEIRDLENRKKQMELEERITSLKSQNFYLRNNRQ